jgi:hypothetical protein
MKEDLLHYVWRTKAFELKNLIGTLGEKIEIQQFGAWNHGSGPDFLEAKIVIDGILWSGNVEMHLNSSEWYRHNHHSDPAYDNVILHVVWEEDKPVYREDGSRICTLLIRDRIHAGIKANYRYLQVSDTWIPCEKILFQVDHMTKLNCLDRMLTERLEKRYYFFQDINNATGSNIEETFYQLLARSYGLKENQYPFQRLAETLPLSVLSRYTGHPELIESALFGQAGFINHRQPTSAYEEQLLKNYRFLKNKHNLEALPPAIWKFGKIRPKASPHLRLAQFAALVNTHPRLFAAFLETKSVDDMILLFNVEISPFWQHHFYLETEAGTIINGSIGRETALLIIINTVLPFMFFYGNERSNDILIDKALQMFQQIAPERNNIIKRWIDLGMPAENAGHTQALLHLKQGYCAEKSCLKCVMGGKLLHLQRNS